MHDKFSYPCTRASTRGFYLFMVETIHSFRLKRLLQAHTKIMLMSIITTVLCIYRLFVFIYLIFLAMPHVG